MEGESERKPQCGLNEVFQEKNTDGRFVETRGQATEHNAQGKERCAASRLSYQADRFLCERWQFHSEEYKNGA